jgi:hypothetical protein
MAPMISPDFTESTGLQPGLYIAHIRKGEQKESRNGNPYLNWVLEVDTGHGKTILMFYATPFSGRGAGLFRTIVQAAHDSNYQSGTINTDLLINKPIQVRLEKETNPDGTQGKYMRVVEVLPVSDAYEDASSF